MLRSRPHKRVTLCGIEYSINEEEKTASVTKYKGNATEIIIPRSIKHESKEYIVTVISNGAFNLSIVKTVSFAPNSELRTIEKKAFAHSELASIQIPSRVTQICEGAFYYCEQLSGVEFEPNSELQTIGESAFSFSSLASIKIPSRVTQICEHAFYYCKQLSGVEFEPNSELQTINKYAFTHSALAKIQIPSHVTQICERAFSCCNQLSRFEFAPNSELRTIEKDAFSFSALARIQIPAGVVELEDGWCFATVNLIEVEVDPGNARYSSVGGKLVIGKSDIANEDYDTLVFCTRDSIEANIPATIKIICAHAFSGSALASIQIPSHVSQICEGAFYYCKKFSRIEFEPNSELRTIGKDAFSFSALASIQIQPHITTIHKDAFLSCKQLQIVEIEEKSSDESFALYKFISSKIVMLPAREKHF